jgi:hypothetical protein
MQGIESVPCHAIPLGRSRVALAGDHYYAMGEGGIWKRGSTPLPAN